MQFIQNNLMLIAIAVASGAMLLWPLIGRRGAKEVGVVQATQLINRSDALLLDVRDDKEYASGHLPHSKHIPSGRIAQSLAELEKYKNRPIIAYCRSGQRSAMVCSVLRKNGFGEVYNLQGGITAWEQANMPVEK